ncbi:hypothetical protein [Flavobacterium sp.]|uniref:hypothetical protein n=1 Tax=Flavobacterium sp. TaxID=239 RepID=UPI00260AF95F|nr:hypothetical protein [Flavobacterium sp.]
MLGKYLDSIYPSIFEGFNVKRISDNEQQHRGIDITISKNGKEFFVDEKAQLDYLEHDLPTFAFEITYIKDGQQRQGWLYDAEKVTDRYFAITGITCNTSNEPKTGFKSCKITSVHRGKLINLLTSKGLTYHRISEINQELRSGTADGKILIPELESRTEGNFHYTTGKAERPINIVLKLEFLIAEGVAKRIH